MSADLAESWGKNLTEKFNGETCVPQEITCRPLKQIVDHKEQLWKQLLDKDPQEFGGKI